MFISVVLICVVGDWLFNFLLSAFVSIYGSNGKSDFAFWVLQGFYFELGKVFVFYWKMELFG